MINKNYTHNIMKETFYFGETEVTLVHPNGYFPEKLGEEEVELFLATNQQNYSESFRALAAATRAYDHLAIDYVTIQKQLIGEYLLSNDIKTICQETGLSETTLRELKNGKRPLSSIRLGSFETLTSCARKAAKT